MHGHTLALLLCNSKYDKHWFGGNS